MRGLAAYPGDPCYDPNRPSWLPYWIDDTAEDECGTGTSNLFASMWDTFTNPSLLTSEIGTSAGEAAGSAASTVANAAATGVEAAGMTAASSLTGGGYGIAIVALLVGGLFLWEAFKR